MKSISIIDAISNKRLLGALPAFRGLETWRAWLVVLRAIFGLPMTESDLGIWAKCTGRSSPPPSSGFKESWIVAARRAGKSFIAAVIGAFIAAFKDFSKHLNVGEKGMVLILAVDRAQARVVFRYLAAIFHTVPALRQMIVAERSDEIELRNGIVVAVKSADYRSVRGTTIVCFIGDEAAFWPSEGVNPSKEIFAAIRPAMATIPDSKFIVISTGYAMTGSVYETYRDHFGRDESDVLVWQSDTRTMNPLISEEMIQREIERDPEAGRAEWLGLFREDVTAAFPLELLERCVIPGRLLLPPLLDTGHESFNDVCGGRRDFWVQGIGHNRDSKIVIDRIDVWKPPLNPSEVAAEASEILKAYGLHATTGDNYAGEWPVAEFTKHGISYQPCDRTKNELYLGLIPLLSAGEVELLDDKRMLEQFRRLERRRGRNGKDTVDHLPSLHDDVANAIAGLAYVLNSQRDRPFEFYAFGDRRYHKDAAVADDAPSWRDPEDIF